MSDPPLASGSGNIDMSKDEFVIWRNMVCFFEGNDQPLLRLLGSTHRVMLATGLK